MDYQNIAPLFTLEFREMSKKELRAYYNWFLSVMPERIKILAKAIKSSPGYEDWGPDFSPDSLDKLGEWFAQNIEKRKLSKEEKEEKYYKNAPAWFRKVDVPDEDLTVRTFSLSFDIGMYLSQVFLKNVPGIEWYFVEKGTKRSINYGQPVLSGFGKVPFNPLHMCVTLAYGLADRTYKGSGLRELYEIWKKLTKSA